MKLNLQKTPDTNYDLKSSRYHDPITILGNNNFTSENGVTSGLGTKNDPYIIKDLIIQANGTENCIFINNTNVFFEIKNCTLIKKNTFPEYVVKLQNVTNGKLVNNTIGGAEVFLFQSFNNFIENNTFLLNSGIIISYSDNNIIYGNILNSCEFKIFDSSHNLISQNHIFNTSVGIELNANVNTTVIGNRIHNVTQYGISVRFKSNNTRILDNYIYFFGFNATDISVDSQGTELSGNTYTEPDENNDNKGGDTPIIPDILPLIIISLIIGGIAGIIILIGVILYRRRMAKLYAPPDLTE